MSSTTETRVAVRNAILALAAAADGQPRVEDTDSVCPPVPYPGLRPFGPADRAVMLGREDQVGEIIAKLSTSQTVVILGGSGCGKSSLIRGGVLPELAGLMPVPGRVGAWYSITFRPETEAVTRLIDAVEDGILRKSEEVVDSILFEARDTRDEATARARAGVVKAAVDVARAGIASLARPVGGNTHPGLAILRQEVDRLDKSVTGDISAPPVNLMVVIDQFEEIFRPGVDLAQRQHMMALIRHVVTERPPGVFLVLAMRSEDLHHCAEEPGLPEIVNQSFYFVDWLDSAQLRDVVTEPARRTLRQWLRGTGTVVPAKPFSEEALRALLDDAQRLKDTLGHKGDHLPLLQHALREVWRAAVARWKKEEEADGANGGEPPSALQVTMHDLRSAKAVAVVPGAPHGTMPPGIPLGLQACLEHVAEDSYSKAASLYDQESQGASAVVDGALALRAAFCEMASLDENRRYHRVFRTEEEVAANRFPTEDNGVRIKGLRAALAIFADRGLLSRGRSGWDVTHEALIRNWPRLAYWVDADKAAAEALVAAIKHLEEHAGPQAASKRRLRRLVPGLWLDGLRAGRSWIGRSIMYSLWRARDGWRASSSWIGDWMLRFGGRVMPPLDARGQVESAAPIDLVLGWNPLPIFTQAWADREARAAGWPGGTARVPLARLRRWRLWQRLMPVLPWLGAGMGLVVLLILSVMVTAWMRDKDEGRIAGLRRDVIRAHAVAANLTSKDGRSLPIALQAEEARAAGRMWQKAATALAPSVAPDQDRLANRIGRWLKGAVTWIAGLALAPARTNDEGVMAERNLAQQTVEGAHRRLLGGTANIRADTEKQPERPEGLCGRAESPAGGLVVRRGGRSVLAGMASGTTIPLRFEVDGGQDVSPMNTVTVTKGTDVCLSNDGQVMTVSHPGQPLPQIFHLTWYLQTGKKGFVFPLGIENPDVVPELGERITAGQARVVAINVPAPNEGTWLVRFQSSGGQALLAEFQPDFIVPVPALNTPSRSATATCTMKSESCRVGDWVLRAEKPQDPKKQEIPVGADMSEPPFFLLSIGIPESVAGSGPFFIASFPYLGGGLKMVALLGEPNPRYMLLTDVEGNVRRLAMVTGQPSVDVALRMIATQRAPHRAEWTGTCKTMRCDRELPGPEEHR